MKNFKDKVAVITGGASGIGFGLAKQCAQEEMHIVLADVEADALSSTALLLRSMGASVLEVQTDVSKSDDLRHLGNKTMERFGRVDLLFNNAGIAAPATTIWESSEADWQWTMNVNLGGVINGLRIFVPIMLRQDRECYIVNTASAAGLIAYYFNAPYHVTKHAVVALSEQLYFSLALQSSKIQVSVLCPGYARTNILAAERNRPDALRNPATYQVPAQYQDIFQQVRENIENGMPVEQLAGITFEAIKNRVFYILSHPELNTVIHQRCMDLLKNQNPDIQATMDFFRSMVAQ